MKYLKKWEIKNKKKVCKSYTYHIQLFIDTANFKLKTATYTDIIKHLEKYRKTGWSAYNLKNHLSAIKFYYSCLLSLDKMTYHPCKNLVLKDRIDWRIATEILFTQEELDTFVSRTTAKTSKTLALRTKIVRQLLVYQAITVSELVSLTTNNIDLENCTLTIKNSRILPLHVKQLLPLQAYLNKQRIILKKKSKTTILILSNNGKPMPSETINGLVNRNFTKRFTPKKIRQSVLCNLLKNNIDLRKVQLFAGHKSIGTTERYLSSNFIALRAELEKYHPL